MEPITSAIVAALASGISSVASDAVKDAYTALKNKLQSTLSKESEAMEALQNLESRPDSKGRQEVLNEELLNCNIAQTADVQMLFNTLLEKLNQTESGKEALSKFTINAEKIGVVGDNVRIKEQKF